MTKVFNLLGLATRAGKIVFGTDAVLKNLGKKQTYIIFVASDASDATIDKVEKKGYFYNIPVIKKYSTIELAKSTGRANPKVIGLNDQGFSKAIFIELERIGD